MGIVLLVLVGGFFIVAQTMIDTSNQQARQVQEESEVVVRGAVTDIDTSQIMLDGPSIVTITDEQNALRMIAVPSMGLRLCAGYPNIAGGGSIEVGDVIEVHGTVDEEGYIVPCSGPVDHLYVTRTYENQEFSFAFEYKTGDSGYVLEEVAATGSEQKDYLYSIMLTDMQDYEEFQSSTEAREAPQTISIRVFENSEELSPFVWVERNQQESNIMLARTEVEEAVVGGANAAHYVSDGLYMNDTYAVAHGGFIYLLMGMTLDPQNEIAADLESIVDSFRFVQPRSEATSQMKVDIKAVCASALATMTFASGQEAATFQEACVNGEHPDVIDRYIESLGLNGAAL